MKTGDCQQEILLALGRSAFPSELLTHMNTPQGHQRDPGGVFACTWIFVKFTKDEIVFLSQMLWLRSLNPTTGDREDGGSRPT
jgi:hypothetical protein